MNTYQIFELELRSSLNFSQPQSLGVDALIMNYPSNASIDEVLLSLGFVKYTSEAHEAMQMNSDEFLEYAKISFFGTGSNAESNKSRNILGKEIQTQILQKKIPKACTLEIGIIPLENNEFIVLGFEISETMNKEEAEKVYLDIISNLK